MTNKIKYIVYGLLIAVAVCYFAGFVLLRIPATQTFIASKTANYMSKKIGSKVSIGKVDIRLFNRVVIDNVTVLDEERDTMLKASRFSASVDLLPLIREKISLSSIQLFGAKINLKRKDANSPLNCQKLIDAFSSKDSKDSKTDIHISSLVIRNALVTYNQEDKPHVNGVFSPYHMAITKLNADIAFDYSTDDKKQDIKTLINRLSFCETTGLTCKSLTTEINSHENEGIQTLLLKNFKLALPRTNIELPEALISFKSFGNGELDTNSLIAKAKIEADAVSLDDFKALTRIAELKDIPTLKLYSNIDVVNSGGKADVNLRSADGRNLIIDLTTKAQDIFTTPQFNTVIRKLNVSEDILKQISCIYALPQQLLSLGDISADGYINTRGKSALETKLSLNTSNVGTADVEFRINETAGNIHYDTHLKTNGLDISKFMNDAKFGILRGDIALKGTLTDKGKIISTHANGIVKEFAYSGNSYNGITIDADYNNGVIKGNLCSTDPKARFNADVDANMSALTADGFSGKIVVKDIYLAHNDVNISKLSLESSNNQDSKTISITTDFGYAEISGNFQLATLSQSLANVVTAHLSHIPYIPEFKATNNDYSINAHIDNLNFIKKIVNIPVDIKKPVDIFGKINDMQNFADITLSVPSAEIASKKIENTVIHISSPIRQLFADINTTILTDAEPVTLNINCTADNGVLNSAVTWNNQRNNVFKGRLNTNTQFFKTPNGTNAFHINIPNSDFEVGDTVWDISSEKITFADNRLSINNLRVGNEKQHVVINGTASASVQDTLAVELKDINVEYILNLINFTSVAFGGKASGIVTANSIFKELNAQAHLEVGNFSFQYGDMGTLYADATYNNTKQQIDLEAIADDTLAKAKTLINGYISPQMNSIDLNIKAENTRLDFMRDFCGSFLNNIDLNGEGNVRLHGTFNALELTGQLVAKGFATVTSTNCRYELPSDTIVLIPGDMLFSNVPIKDKYGNIANVSGGIHHRHLGRIAYDVHIKTDKLLAYDIPTLDGSNYCGKAVIQGNVGIKGKGNELNVDADVTTLDDSYIIYNTTSPDMVSNKDFITWGSLNEKKEATDDSTAINTSHANIDNGNQRTNIRLKFNVNVTPKAKLHLLMDAISGDYIDLFGNGQLQISFYNKGAFQIFGNYNIDHGIYRMTIQNILRREFAFQNGSLIAFGGDPFEATLRMKAAYMLNSVSLADLNIGTSFKANNVPVNCLMNITGTAGRPLVDFSLDLPTLDNEAKQMVYSIVNSDESMNQQVLYLLAIGRFYSSDKNRNDDSERTGQTTLAMQSFLSGTFSQQLNQVLNQLTNNNNWSFGANIATGTDGMSNAEYEGILSGRMLNNRLLFNGQFGYRDNIMTNSQSFIGDFTIQYLLTPNGNVALKMYNQTNDRYFTRNSLNTQGIGIVLKKDFGK